METLVPELVLAIGDYELGVYEEILAFMKAVLQPLYLAGLGAAALYFLATGRVSALLRYGLAAVVIGAFIFVPEAVQGVAQGIADVITGRA